MLSEPTAGAVSLVQTKPVSPQLAPALTNRAAERNSAPVSRSSTRVMAAAAPLNVYTPFWLALVCFQTSTRSPLERVTPSIAAPGAARSMLAVVATRAASFQLRPFATLST